MVLYKKMQVLCLLLLPIFSHAAASPLSISLTASNPNLTSCAQQILNLHGDFSVTESDQANYRLTLLQDGPNQISLKLSPGKNAQPSYTHVITGNTPNDTLYKACDHLVHYLLNAPSFFSSKIAFVAEVDGKPDVFTSDILLLNPIQRTHDAATCLTPKFSPDGQFLIFTTFASGFSSIETCHILSGKRKSIASYTGTNIGGVFHPHENALAMTLSSSGDTDLYIANLDGSNPKRLTQNKAVESSPCWSPDGNFIYFASDPSGKPQLFSIQARGGRPQALPVGISAYCAEPTVNPKFPHLIAFTVAKSGKFRIALFDSISQATRYITDERSRFVEPSWASDGRHLIATRRLGDSSALTLLDTLSSKQTALPLGGFQNTSMASMQSVR